MPARTGPAASLAELRARYLHGDETASAKLIAELAADPRKGAQALGRALKKRRDAARGERLRLEAMLHFERVLWQAGIKHIAGVDEVGVGPLAGPVVAAAVVLPPDIDVDRVDDSKKLDPATREEIAAALHDRAVAIAIGAVDVADIDRLNVYQAGREAMRRAVTSLSVAPQHVLTDARAIPGLGDLPQNAFDKGDGLNYSIACASIVAKVHRDRLMCALDEQYPGYGFAEHKGYGTAKHLDAVRRLGPCPQHRMSYPAIRELTGDAGSAFYELKQALDDAGSLRGLDDVRGRIRAAAAELTAAEVRKLQALVGRRRKRLTPG